ncbi:MAG: ABC transporter ATP-binding protein [Gammaproteobacteria bacterium]|nr:ABC transporter ATP-binding protein [Gammaproteobacteria bacterium]MBU1724145.1 ABC transporter ATP-binding protein [Gammaproteobacteria bacterium]MBU2006449.1 ABC transporter ATP-binding protein [Gammaproteobacteria bacterium]
MLKANHLRYAYPEAGHKHTVLQDVSLELHAGEHVALMGSSGSGKSTLLNLLGGIDTPAGGEIMIAGSNLTQLREPQLTLFRRQHIGFIYQQFNLIPTLTVAENMLLPLELLGVPRQQQQQRLQQWLEAVQLPTRGSAFPDQLSGGEQQRVAIARALIHRPALVLADEPTGNLDAQTGTLVLDLLFTLAEREQQTLLVVTHSKAVAERAGRILLLRDGQLHTDGQTVTW